MPDVDPDRSAYDLFAIYGALMQQVQTYELLLATLALIVEADPRRISNASLERQLRNAIRRGVHAFQRGSPSQSRDRIEGRVSEELFSEVAGLVEERNRLAHAFLVQQLDGDAVPPRFRRGTALQIIQYAQRFGAANAKLDTEIRARAADLPEAPEQIGELIERLAHSIALGTDPVKSRRQGSSPAH